MAAQKATYQVPPEALREFRENLPAGAVLTVSSGRGIDTIGARARVVLRAGEILVAKQGESVAVPQVYWPGATQSVPEGTASSSSGGDSTAVVTTSEGSLATTEDTLLPSGHRLAAVVVLPYNLAVHDSANPTTLRRLQARVEVIGGGFHYDFATRSYVSQVLVGIVEPDNPGQRITLSDIFIQIGGEVDRAEPRIISLLRTSVPFQEVVLRAVQPRADSVRLRVISTFDPRGITIAVPVFVPPLMVSASPIHISGFGLEKTDVLIMPPSAGQMPMIVTALHAHPDPGHLNVGGAEPAVVQVRSQGVGIDTITVTGGVYHARVEVVYDPPWFFVAAVLGGGVLGGLLNGLSRRRRVNSTMMWRIAMRGVLTGLGVAILYALGIHIFSWAPDAVYGEALVFAVSFMGGLAGPRIFDTLLPAHASGEGVH